MSETARFELLGNPILTVRGEVVRLPRKQTALLALLTLRPHDQLDRGDLARLLWPGSSSGSARHSLSQALYALKATSPNRSIVVSTSNQLIVRDVISDVEEFEKAIQSGDWAGAARLYRGTFLNRLDVPGSREFRAWVEPLRLHYIAVATAVLEALRLDGLSEQASLLAARLPLNDEWRDDPFDAEVSGPAEQHEQPGSAAPFVGRRHEMDLLERIFLQSASSGFAGVVIEGEPGIGKTALANRFARLRALRGARGLSAKAFLAEQNLPFGVVAQWLREVDHHHLHKVPDRWIGLVREAFPDVLSCSPSVAGDHTAESFEGTVGEYRLLEALRHAFLAAGGGAPLLLLLDDAHLADAASLRFIHYFARRSPEAAVLFIATLRAPCLYGAEPFAGWDRLERIQLRPLSANDTEALVSRFLTESALPTTELIAELSRKTGRNPLLLVSILSAGCLPPTAEVPDSVVEFFVPRLDALSRDAAHLLAALSLGGETSDRGVVARISGMADTPANLDAALSELEAAALVVRESEDGIRTRHGVVGEIAISRLHPADRKALYGRAARTLDEEGLSHPAVLAVQHDIAGHQASAFASALTAATASRELHAPREHAFFLKLALSNAPDPFAEADIRIQLAELYRRTGRTNEGLDIVSDAVMTSATPLQQSVARATRLRLRLAAGDTRLTNAEVRQQIDELSEILPPLTMAELCAAFAAMCHDLGERSFTLTAANRALALISELPPSPACVIATTRAAGLLGLYSNVYDGLDAIGKLLPAADSNLEALSQCLAAEATLLVAAGRLIEAEAKFLRAIELIERCCMYEALFLVHNNLGVCYSELGRYDDGQRHLDEAARIGKEFARPSVQAITADNTAMVRLERGDYDLALRTAQAAVTRADSRAPRALFHRHGLIGLCSLELGLVAQAFEAKREIELLIEHHEYWSSDVSYVEMFLARMLAMEGDLGAARQRLEAAIEIFRPRDLMGQARLELEVARLDLKADPKAALQRSEVMLDNLRGTGARPHIERFEAVVDRARLRSA